MGYRIAIDTGGTFTDLVLTDEKGSMLLGKAPTTPARAFLGVEAALGMTADQIQMDVTDILKQTDLVIYGTTRATNAIIEGKTAKTAFLTTEGFPDVLVLREGGKFNAFDLSALFPKPYVPRRLTFEISERIDSEGNIVTPLDEEQARRTLKELRRLKVEAIGVCLLWAQVNPVHEEVLGRLIEAELPEAVYTLSHRINPIVREYRRASSTVIDASLKPLMQRHLNDLADDLRLAGFEGELLVATSFGGVMHLADVVQRAIYLVKSGPAMAPVAGRTYASAETGPGDIVVCDTGGTSFDVSLVRDGVIKFTRDTWLGEQFSGHITGLASVDVKSIGAGGGSIAWIDPGGLLRVGPHSAGSEPGPACYCRSGSEPTVTDAAMVLGYLDPDYFLGGRMKLDPAQARAAVAKIAQRLGRTVEEAARAILEIANEHMVGAIKDITINQGIDPRESLIVAGGGAAGLNIVPIARELGCRRILVPRSAGALSACGGQFSDIISDFSMSKLAYSNDFPYGEVNDVLERIQGSIEEFTESLRRRGLRKFSTQYFVEARYSYQVWELDVALEQDRFDGPAHLQAMVEAFHREHERVFAVKEPGQQIECVYWRGRLIAELDRPPLRKETGPSGNGSKPHGFGRAYFSPEGETKVPHYRGEELAPGAVIEGPSIIFEPTTTIVVYPRSRTTVTELRNYLFELD